MWQLILIAFICVCVRDIGCAIPPYMKPCSKADPNFQKCCVDRGNEALPFLVQGDKQFKIPNLLPLKFPKIDVNAGPDLKIKLLNVNLYGMDTVKLTDMNVNFADQTAYIQVHADFATLIGEYEVDGKILVLPIKGNGPMNITVSDGVFKYMFSYKLESRGGTEYAILQDDDSLEFKVKKAYFRLDNLFGGNKQMGDNVNNFLNENDQDVVKELGGAVTGTISVLARRVGGSVLKTIPFKDLFLD